jgi:integrase
MHRVLFSALGQAERWKLIARNPVALLEKRDRPKIERKPVSTIDAPTSAKVFDAAREERIFITLILATLRGLRRGEITALRWKAVDLIVLSLRSSPVQSNSTRDPFARRRSRTVEPERSNFRTSPLRSCAAGALLRQRNC